MSVTLHPVPGRTLEGVPAVPISVTQKLADRLVRTGAFSEKRAGPKADDEPAPVDIVEDAIARLDFYDPPVKHGEHYKTFKGGPPPTDKAFVEPEPPASAEPAVEG